jgi:hypothetical protein
MNTFESIRLAYLAGIEREASVDRGGTFWYLEETAPPTERAEEAAAQAYLAAGRGDFQDAVRLASMACELELVEYGDCPTWRPLREAARNACRPSGAV